MRVLSINRCITRKGIRSNALAGYKYIFRGHFGVDEHCVRYATSRAGHRKIISHNLAHIRVRAQFEQARVCSRMPFSAHLHLNAPITSRKNSQVTIFLTCLSKVDMGDVHLYLPVCALLSESWRKTTTVRFCM